MANPSGDDGGDGQQQELSFAAGFRGFMRDGKMVSSSSSPSLMRLEDSSSSSSSASSSRNMVRSASSADLSPGHLSLGVAFHSLLHHLCSFYEADPVKRQKLFDELNARLSGGLSLMTSPVFQAPEFASLRLHYQRAFDRLVRVSQGAVERSLDPTVGVGGIPRSMAHGLGPSEFFQTSRYRSEFREVRFLARGGFGAVFRATNLLDGCDYAVKKIVLKYCDRDVCAKILREVTTLARLSHPNVVCYKTAWLEPFVAEERKKSRQRAIAADADADSTSWSPPATGRDCGRCEEMPAEDSLNLSYRHRRDDSPSSSGVVFEASGDVQAQEDSARDDAVDAPRSLKTGPFKIPARNGVVIREVEDSELESDIPLVMGHPATPPNHQGFDERAVYFLNGNDVDEVDKGAVVPAAAAAPVASSSLSSSSSWPQRRDRAMLYLQMQLCEQTLRHWLDERNQKGEPICEAENDRIFRQILKGTAYMHEKGVIHRDLKPKNIFLSQGTSVVQIGDFGLAKQEILGNVETPTAYFDGPNFPKPGLSRASSLHTSGVGTQAYAAPEQLESGLIDEKSDMYSLGIILFELYWPFSTAMERVCATKDLRTGKLPDGSTSVRSEIRELVLRLTSTTPEWRPTAAELLDATFSSGAGRRRDLERRVRALESKVKSQERMLQEKDREIERLKASLAAKTD